MRNWKVTTYRIFRGWTWRTQTPSKKFHSNKNVEVVQLLMLPANKARPVANWPQVAVALFRMSYWNSHPDGETKSKWQRQQRRQQQPTTRPPTTHPPTHPPKNHNHNHKQQLQWQQQQSRNKKQLATSNKQQQFWYMTRLTMIRQVTDLGQNDLKKLLPRKILVESWDVGAVSLAIDMLSLEVRPCSLVVIHAHIPGGWTGVKNMRVLLDHRHLTSYSK